MFLCLSAHPIGDKRCAKGGTGWRKMRLARWCVMYIVS